MKRAIISPLKRALRKADENRVEYPIQKFSLFRAHRTISALTVSIPSTVVRRHRVLPSHDPTQDAVFLPAVGLTGAGATAAEELVSRLYVTKTGPPPAPTVDVFCTVRASLAPS